MNVIKLNQWVNKRKQPVNWHLVRSLVDQSIWWVNELLDLWVDTDDNWRSFLDWGHSIFGYNKVVIKDWEITDLLSSSDKPKLSKWDKVFLKWDSRGYISSWHWDGENVTIVEFAEPFMWSRSDNIIKVKSEDWLEWWVKPSNVRKIT